MDLYLVYKLRPKRTGFNMYAENTQPQLTFLALLPCLQCIISVSKVILKILFPLNPVN